MSARFPTTTVYQQWSWLLFFGKTIAIHTQNSDSGVIVALGWNLYQR